MKKRWTIKELAAVNDAQFTMEILRERRSERRSLFARFTPVGGFAYSGVRAVR